GTLKLSIAYFWILTADVNSDGRRDLVIGSEANVEIAANVTEYTSIGAIVNAATFDLLQPVSAGSAASIFGFQLGDINPTQAASIPLPNSLANVSVSFNGIQAPLYFVSAQQINAQVPWGAGTNGTAQVVVTRNDFRSAAFTVALGQFSPGI